MMNIFGNLSDDLNKKSIYIIQGIYCKAKAIELMKKLKTMPEIIPENKQNNT